MHSTLLSTPIFLDHSLFYYDFNNIFTLSITLICQFSNFLISGTLYTLKNYEDAISLLFVY